MNTRSIELDCLKFKIKGPLGASEQQIMEAAILHFILKLPADERPAEGSEIDVSSRVGGRIPRFPKKS